MEHILSLLPRKPRSVLVRFAITTALVGLSFVLLLALRQRGGLLGFYLLLPCIFLASVVFDRTAGLFATVLSTALLYVLLTPNGSVLLPRVYVLPLAAFAAIALGFAIMSEALRTAWERAAAAEKAKDLLLKELAHRTKNNLMMVASLLSMQAGVKTDPATRQALEKAVARVQAIASAHEHFQPIEHHGRVEMRSYLEQLCTHLAEALRDVRPIAMKVDAAQIYLPAEEAIPLGLIVNELVTNSLKHAFSDARPGRIEVVLTHDSAMTLIVRDNGHGCPAQKVERVGSRLVRMLAQQLDARIEWQQPAVGCEVKLVCTAPGSEAGTRRGRAGSGGTSGQKPSDALATPPTATSPRM
jgi:two-component system, sensor histidine kinase PdtaS